MTTYVDTLKLILEYNILDSVHRPIIYGLILLVKDSISVEDFADLHVHFIQARDPESVQPFYSKIVKLIQYAL